VRVRGAADVAAEGSRQDPVPLVLETVCLRFSATAT